VSSHHWLFPHFSRTTRLEVTSTQGRACYVLITWRTSNDPQEAALSRSVTRRDGLPAPNTLISLIVSTQTPNPSIVYHVVKAFFVTVRSARDALFLILSSPLFLNRNLGLNIRWRRRSNRRRHSRESRPGERHEVLMRVATLHGRLGLRLGVGHGTVVFEGDGEDIGWFPGGCGGMVWSSGRCRRHSLISISSSFLQLYISFVDVW
jgi:hypothetical protein